MTANLIKFPQPKSKIAVSENQIDKINGICLRKFRFSSKMTGKNVAEQRLSVSCPQQHVALCRMYNFCRQSAWRRARKRGRRSVLQGEVSEDCWELISFWTVHFFKENSLFEQRFGSKEKPSRPSKGNSTANAQNLSQAEGHITSRTYHVLPQSAQSAWGEKENLTYFASCSMAELST